MGRYHRIGSDEIGISGLIVDACPKRQLIELLAKRAKKKRLNQESAKAA